MSDDRDDSVLDACLDEVLGDRTPPNLTSRIMQALATRSRSGPASDVWPPMVSQEAPLDIDVIEPEPPPILAAVPQVLVDTAPHAVVARRESTNLRDRSKRWSLGLTIAVSVCVVAVGLVIAVTALVSRSSSPVARAPAKPQTNTPSSAPSTEVADVANTPRHDPDKEAPLIAADVSVPAPQPQVDSHPLVEPGTRQPTDHVAGSVASVPAAAQTLPEKRTLPASSDREIVSFVNVELSRSWNEAGVKPTPPVSDAEWCQRLFSRVLGRAPSSEELKNFADDKASDRREKLVERLLTARDYADEYARHWSAVWTNILIGRNRGVPGSPASREELEKYLHAALVANKSFDKIAQELLTATGSARPGADDYNPAVSFLLDGMNADATVATARVARVLLGHQLQCAQCHTHPSQGWSQEDFWALNAFFRQMRAARQGDIARLVNVAPGEGGSEAFYETPTGLMKTALPRFIDGTEIPVSGDAATVDRRRELAALVVRSDDMPKAIVNRVWAQFFDYGFTWPVDDLAPRASAPALEVLNRLAAEFAAHEYDLKKLIRWAVLSDPFSRSSKITDLASKDMPEEGEPALFSRYYARPTQTAEVVSSLVQAARIRRTAGTDAEVEKARIDWLAQFNRGPGRDSGKAVGQSLMIKGGGPIRATATSEPSGLVTRLAASNLQFEKKVEHLFLAAVARQPTRREQAAAAEILRSGKASESAALADIWWALRSSSECALDH